MKRISLFFSFALTALFACAAPLHAISQTGQYSFTHINTSNSNISYDGISKIFQDSRGYMWIGTFKGLNRYDGSRFDVYYKDALGLDSDFIHTIIEDSEGNLWIGTDNGVSRYIYKEDRFEAFALKADNGAQVRNKVTFLYQDSRSRIWIVANYQGCFCYDPVDGAMVNFFSPKRNAPEYYTDETPISLRRMVEDQNGGFWVSRYHSSLLYAQEDLHNLSVIQTPFQKDYFSGDQVEQMWFLDGRLLVASNNHGVSSYNPSTRKVVTLFDLPEAVTLVDAYLDDDRNIWLCTTEGVWKYNINDASAVYIAPDSQDPLALSGHYVFTAYVDRDGGLWLGTKDGGVSYSGPFQNNFTKVTSASGKSLKGAVVTDFTTDGNGTVWVTTEEMGLLRCSISGGKCKTVPVMNKNIPKNLCFCCFDNGKIWLGTFDGLLCYDVATDRVRNYGHLKRRSGIIDPRVYRGFKTQDGSLYFSNTLGLFRYDADNDSFRQMSIFDGVFITSIAEHGDGTLWISSYAQGMFHYDPQTDALIHTYRMNDGSKLPSDKIASVIVDSNGQVWTIGFNCGISKLEENGNFITYNVENTPSIPSNVFFSAVFDSEGYLWLASDKGLVKCFLPTMTFTNYSVPDGLLDSKLTNSLCQMSNGDIFAGSDNGFVVFNPSAFHSNCKAPDVILSQMRIGNKAFSGNVDLQKEIHLESSQNSFGFQFSLMSFGARADCHVKCLLDGFDTDWVDASSEKQIYYFNVPHGSYYLRIMSSGDGYKWEECHEPVKIVVEPTFFASMPGLCLIILLFLTLLLAAVYVAKKRQQRISRAEEEIIRKSTEEEAFRDKMNFFSHVIHEIKTPLTLIRTPLQSIVGKETIDDEARHDLQVMENNTEYLTSLVNELLEFVRVERKGYTLNCVKIDIAERLSSILFNYQDTATSKNIRLNSKVSKPHIWVYADSSALDKMINNLLINALKHAEALIEINLSEQDANVVLDIANDGDTIPAELVHDVFKPFVQYHAGDNKLRKGVGIGLPLARSLARMHSGDIILLEGGRTMFRLTLPRSEAPAPAAASDGGGVRRHSKFRSRITPVPFCWSWMTIQRCVTSCVANWVLHIV